MKKLKFAAMAVLGAGLMFSCSSDDDGGSGGTSGELLGKWYNQSYRVGGITIPYDDHETCDGQLTRDYVEFLTSTTGRFVDVWDCEEEIDAFTYSRSGNSITVTDGDFVETATITALTSTTLELQVSYDFDGDGTDEVVTEVYSRN